MKQILILAALLAGCDDIRPPADPGNQSSFQQQPQGVAIYHDFGTGCEYVSADSQHSALTPRIAADGKTHMGCKAARP